jgi:small neutral amino acid transporter SnatA (MarC family)
VARSFFALTPNLTLARRRWTAVNAALSILVILAASALAGLKIWSIFNFSQDAFRRQRDNHRVYHRLSVAPGW